MSNEQQPHEQSFLSEKLQNDPSDWETRRRLAQLLYDNDQFHEAAEVVWMADHIPSNDIDLAYAARLLAKAQPRKAIRLLTAVLELNRGKAVQNMGMANALLHHGMVLQAARFYGAALEADPTLVNPDLEHFILWTDDEMSLWGDFTESRPKLGELPWMARDPMEALRLTSRVTFHTTPISVPSLPSVPGEEILNELYQQEIRKRGKITPPPAVTIPIDRVNPKDRRYDDRYGATVVGSDIPPVEEEGLQNEEEAPQDEEPTAGVPGGVVPATAGVSLPNASPMPPIVPPPMAIPVPDHVVSVHAQVPLVAAAAPIAPVAPGRTPSSLPGAPVAMSLNSGAAPSAAPTRRLITPGGKPMLPAKSPAAITGPLPPKAG